MNYIFNKLPLTKFVYISIPSDIGKYRIFNNASYVKCLIYDITPVLLQNVIPGSNDFSRIRFLNQVQDRLWTNPGHLDIDLYELTK